MNANENINRGQSKMRNFKTHEIYIGDYSILIHIPADATPEETKEIIKNTFNLELANYGLKVVNA